MKTSIWVCQLYNHQCENKLRDIEQIVFCGYSFPEADMHIKYLLKRIQVNSRNNFKVTVINNYDGKDKKLAEDEKFRFKRFLGQIIDYTDKSFENFAQDPGSVLS